MQQTNTAARRIEGIDICRSIAIVGVMFGHAMSHYSVLERLDPDTALLFRMVLQAAPPVFISLFGAMLEIIYLPRFRADQKWVVQRLLTRALQCYLLYVMSLIVQWAFGAFSAGYMLRCALLIGMTPYTDILKFYAVALLIAPLLLFFRMRIGVWPFLLFAVGVHFLFPVIKGIGIPSGTLAKEYLEPAIDFAYGGGHGDRVGGPSVLHGMTYVMWGMVMGHALKGWMSGEARRQHWSVIVLAAMQAGALIAMIAVWRWVNPELSVAELPMMAFRNTNAPLYFAAGAVALTATVIGCFVTFDVWKVRAGRSVKFMGRTSLFTFGFGNSIIYALPEAKLEVIAGMAAAVCLTALICLQSWVFAWLQKSPGTANLSAADQVRSAVQLLLARINGAIEGAVRPFASGYAGLLSLCAWRSVLAKSQDQLSVPSRHPAKVVD